MRLEELVDAAFPERISGVHFSSRQPALLAEKLGLEVANHGVAGGDARTGRSPRPHEPSVLIRPKRKLRRELLPINGWDIQTTALSLVTQLDVESVLSGDLERALKSAPNLLKQ